MVHPEHTGDTVYNISGNDACRSPTYALAAQHAAAYQFAGNPYPTSNGSGFVQYCSSGTEPIPLVDGQQAVPQGFHRLPSW